MKRTKKLLFALSLTSMVTLASCSPNEPKKDEPVDPVDPVNPVEPIIPEVIKPIYGEINHFEGSLDTNFPLKLSESSTLNLNLLTSNISFSYQLATNIEDIDYYKGLKFHLNLDLYSDETSFTSSLLNQLLLPKLFPEFKYTKLLNNISDLDIYYLADGMLYASISNIEGELPSRMNEISIKNAKRNVLNISRIEVKSIINSIEENIKNNSKEDITSTLIEISNKLNDTILDIENITKIFMYSYLTILDEGFNFKLKEEGVNSLSYLLNSTLVNLLNSSSLISSLGFSIPSSSELINISDFEIEYTKNNFKIDCLGKNSTSPLFKFNISKKDSNQEIDPSYNIEESYYYIKDLINKVDELYTLKNIKF